MSTLSTIHVLRRRAAAPSLALAAGLMLSGCVSTGSQQAKLPDIPKDKTTAQTKVATAPVPARLPAERASDPQIAAAGEPVMVDPQPVALDTPPATETAALVAEAQPVSLDELVMQPTTATANSSSIFASRQTAYAPPEGLAGSSTSTSLVPQNLPTRAGINPSVGSLFSAPKPAESYQAYAEPAMESQPEPMAEQLVTPEPAEVAYDPAEPVTDAAAAAGTPKKKSFSLMRMLGRKGG